MAKIERGNVVCVKTSNTVRNLFVFYKTPNKLIVTDLEDANACAKNYNPNSTDWNDYCVGVFDLSMKTLDSHQYKVKTKEDIHIEPSVLATGIAKFADTMRLSDDECNERVVINKVTAKGYETTITSQNRNVIVPFGFIFQSIEGEDDYTDNALRDWTAIKGHTKEPYHDGGFCQEMVILYKGKSVCREFETEMGGMLSEVISNIDGKEPIELLIKATEQALRENEVKTSAIKYVCSSDLVITLVGEYLSKKTLVPITDHFSKY